MSKATWELAATGLELKLLFQNELVSSNIRQLNRASINNNYNAGIQDACRHSIDRR